MNAERAYRALPGTASSAKRLQAVKEWLISACCGARARAPSHGLPRSPVSLARAVSLHTVQPPDRVGVVRKLRVRAAGETLEGDATLASALRLTL